MIKSKNLVLFRNLKHQDLFDQMIDIINGENLDYFSAVAKLVEFSSLYNFSGNLYHVFLTFILTNNENAFTLSSEMVGRLQGSLNDLGNNDFKIFKSLFDFDLSKLKDENGINSFSLITDFVAPNNEGKIFNNDLRIKMNNMAKNLANAKSIEEFYQILVDYYQNYGVGKYGFHKAFRLNTENGLEIEPIANTENISFSDLVGYEWQKNKLIKNTLDFVNGEKSNNVLLYGDSGTGKSSSIKAVLNKFAPQGLRIIEVYKHEFPYLNRVISMIKNRNYKFIIYMDDLSFESFEIEYKYLKAVIEGDLETKPRNVLIYATSNRRHLVKETVQDNGEINDDLHRNETSAEKLSLAARFGVSILYSKPNHEEYKNIILELAKKNNITIPEDELLKKASMWELHYGGLSGRTAVQFINYIKSGNTEF